MRWISFLFFFLSSFLSILRRKCKKKKMTLVNETWRALSTICQYKAKQLIVSWFTDKLYDRMCVEWTETFFFSSQYLFFFLFQVIYTKYEQRDRATNQKDRKRSGNDSFSFSLFSLLIYIIFCRFLFLFS
jgi:hypothetical protein